MKRLLVFVMVMLAPSLVVAAGPEDGIREAGAGWRQGAIKQDKALLEKYLADDLVYTHGGGQKQTKAEYIASVLPEVAPLRLKPLITLDKLPELARRDPVLGPCLVLQDVVHPLSLLPSPRMTR